MKLMIRLFKFTTIFDKQWKELGLDDDDQVIKKEGDQRK